MKLQEKSATVKIVVTTTKNQKKSTTTTTTTTVDELKHSAQKKVQIVRPLPRQESIERHDVKPIHSDVTTPMSDVSDGSSANRAFQDDQIVINDCVADEKIREKRQAVESAC